MMTDEHPVDECRIAKLGESRVADICAVQESVCSQLALPELYFPLAHQEIEELTGPDAICVGAEAGGRLVGFFGVLFMGKREDNVGHDLGLPSHELQLVAYFKAINVLPEYRGRGLQKRLTQALFAEMGVDPPPTLASGHCSIPPAARLAHQPFEWLCSTVSPRNQPSLKSFIDCGFVVQGLKPKYRGYMRFLMNRRRQYKPREHGDFVPVPVTDYETQINLLKRGWVGVALEGGRTDSQIRYVPFEG